MQYDEPLAEATPAAFYYARAKSFEALQSVLDEADRFITPAVRLLDEQRSRHNLSDRCRLQLALPNDGRSRLFGPTLVESLAAVGSDPFLRQGSDFTLIVLPKDVSSLRSALALKRAKLSATVPLSASKLVHAGIEIERHASSDGSTVNQYSAVVQAASGKSLFLLSNSRGAIQSVIDTVLGQQSNLASELDFQYMIRRDPAVAEQLLVYFGDAFVQSSMEPARRVLNGRRQLAKAELRAPGHAALVHGDWAVLAPRPAVSTSRPQTSNPALQRHHAPNTALEFLKRPSRLLSACCFG